MKKASLIVLVLLLVSIINPIELASAALLLDYYSETNYASALELAANHPSAGATQSAWGQTFNATTTADLTNVIFYMMKANNPTGNGHAVLYAHTGVFGTSGKPTGAALATSDNFDVTTLTGAMALTEFTFSGGEIYELQEGTQYCIAFVNPGAGINAANHVRIGADGSSPTHEGNSFRYASSAWSDYAAMDLVFYVFLAGNTIPENIDVDTDGTLNRNQYDWLNVTVSDYPLSHLATVDVQVNTTNDYENFTLRWTQATDAFSELSDPDGICTLGANSVSEEIDPLTILLSFNLTITGGTSGSCDVKVTSIDDSAASDTDTYNAEFDFSYYGWDDLIYDWIDSAFEQFGLFNYMAQITVFINGLTTYFADSLTHLLALTIQQFRVITNVYNFVVFWITELIGVALDFSVFYQSVVDGTSGWDTGIGDFWGVIEYDLWAPVVPLLLFIWWMESLAKRGAQTVGGELQVFINDMNTGISIVSYFVSMFSFVANTIIDRVYGLFDAIV